MLTIYFIYSFCWGLKGYLTEKTTAGYAIGGRSIPFIAFLMAATAASFSGCTFIGHPGLIWRDGLAYAFALFYVLTIPITGPFLQNGLGFRANATGLLSQAKGEVAWTVVMVLTYMFSLMGIRSSPAFTMNLFGIKNPKPLPWQQAFMSTFVVGFALFYFTAFQGMGVKVLELKGVLQLAKDSDSVNRQSKQRRTIRPEVVS